MSLLLLFGGASTGGGGGVTPIATGKALAIITPDEVATGVSTRLWAEYVDNSSAFALDNPAQVTIWRIPSSGTRVAEVACTTMTAAGDGYYYDWAPTQSGVFLIHCAGQDAGSPVLAVSDVTARPKFDPIALATSEVLAARM